MAIRLHRGQELAVGGLDDVRLGDGGHLLDAVLLGMLEGQLDDPVRALLGGDAEIDGQVVVDVDAPAAEDVASLGVLPEEYPIDPLLRDAHRTDVGEQVQLAAHGHVRRFDVRPLVALLGGGGRPLEDDMAFLDLLQYVIRDGLEHLGPVLDGQSLDGDAARPFPT